MENQSVSIEFISRVVARTQLWENEEWNHLCLLIRDRLAQGMKTYGVPLTSHNGRDALLDAWEEACDLCQYLTQAKLEGSDVFEELESAIDLFLKLTRVLRNRENNG